MNAFLGKGVFSLLDLLVVMLERVGMIVAVAFILTRFPFFKNLIHHDKLNRKQKFTAILFFGFFGIAGTYFGVAFNTNTLHFNSVAISIDVRKRQLRIRVSSVLSLRVC